MGSVSKALLPVLWIAAACVPLSAQQNQSSEVILKQIRAHHHGIAVWWMGNSGWLIKSGDLLIATDLDLDANDKSDPKIHPPPLTPQQLAGELDVEFVTHQHGDHCNIPPSRALPRVAGPCLCCRKVVLSRSPRSIFRSSASSFPSLYIPSMSKGFMSSRFMRFTAPGFYRAHSRTRFCRQHRAQLRLCVQCRGQADSRAGRFGAHRRAPEPE